MSYKYKRPYPVADWKGKLKEIVFEFQTRRFTGKQKFKVSNATTKKRSGVIFLCFTQIREGGFKLNDPLNIKPKHVIYLVNLWLENNLSPSTITNRISIMKLFTEFIGKPGLVLSPEEYVMDKTLVKRNYVNEDDKSWKAKEIDAEQIAQQAIEIDPYSGHQILLMMNFGLRLKEAVSMKPFKSDYGEHLLVMDGTKGGRTRIVPIDSPSKRFIVDSCKKLVSTIDKNMCAPERRIEQEINRLYYVMKLLGITQNQLGLTAHGLRHQYLNDRYEEVAGHPSPVIGGTIIDHEKDNHARLVTMLEAGHGRVKVGAAYYGSSKVK